MARSATRLAGVGTNAPSGWWIRIGSGPRAGGTGISVRSCGIRRRIYRRIRASGRRRCVSHPSGVRCRPEGPHREKCPRSDPPVHPAGHEKGRGALPSDRCNAIGAGFALPRDAGRRPALQAVHALLVARPSAVRGPPDSGAVDRTIGGGSLPAPLSAQKRRLRFGSMRPKRNGANGFRARSRVRGTRIGTQLRGSDLFPYERGPDYDPAKGKLLTGVGPVPRLVQDSWTRADAWRRRRAFLTDDRRDRHGRPAHPFCGGGRPDGGASGRRPKVRYVPDVAPPECGSRIRTTPPGALEGVPDPSKRRKRPMDVSSL